MGSRADPDAYGSDLAGSSAELPAATCPAFTDTCHGGAARSVVTGRQSRSQHVPSGSPSTRDGSSDVREGSRREQIGWLHPGRADLKGRG